MSRLHLTPPDRIAAAPDTRRRVPLQRTRSRSRSASYRPAPPPRTPEGIEPGWVEQLMLPVRGRVVVQASAAVDRVETVSARWHDRRALSIALRVGIFLVPLIASVTAALVLAILVPRPSGVLPVVAWWMLLVVAGTVAMVLVDRVGRRFLPLAALLRMSLVFPDHAPSRFSVAARAGSIRTLQRHLEQAKSAGVRDEPARAAEQIITLVGALAMHDRRTRGHSERVRAFTDLLSEELKLSPMDRERLRWAALLHDVGKLDIAPALLNKPGAPTDAEWQQLREHPIRGAQMIGPLLPWLGAWSAAIEQHHERWDGHGYPYGLSGDQIAMGARIVAVADAFEVMTAPRPYRRPVTAEAAREELASCAGQHFDPVVVRAFLNVSIGRLRKAMGPLSWAAQLPFIGMLPRAEALLGIFGRDAVTAATTAAAGVGVVTVGTLVPGTTSVAAADAPEPVSHGVSVNRFLDIDSDSAGFGSTAAATRTTGGTRTAPRWQIGENRVAAALGASSTRLAPAGTATVSRPGTSAASSSKTAQAPAQAQPRAKTATDTGKKPATTDTGKQQATAPVAAPRTAVGAGGGTAPRTAQLPARALAPAKRRAEEVAAVVPAVPAVRTGTRAVPAVTTPLVRTADRSR